MSQVFRASDSVMVCSCLTVLMKTCFGQGEMKIHEEKLRCRKSKQMAGSFPQEEDPVSRVPGPVLNLNDQGLPVSSTAPSWGPRGYLAHGRYSKEDMWMNSAGKSPLLRCFLKSPSLPQSVAMNMARSQRVHYNVQILMETLKPIVGETINCNKDSL